MNTDVVALALAKADEGATAKSASRVTHYSEIKVVSGVLKANCAQSFSSTNYNLSPVSESLATHGG